MDLVQELLLTVLIAALLSFVVAKLVSVAAAKDISGDTVSSSSPAMEQVIFEDRLPAPHFDTADRVQFLEGVIVGKVDQFDAGKFLLPETEAQEAAAATGEEIGVENCDQRPEAPESLPEAGLQEKVNVCKDSKIERSDAQMKSPLESISGEASFEENLYLSEEIQTEPSSVPLESTELPQKLAVDVELNEKLLEAAEIGQSSAQEVKRRDTEPEKAAHAAQPEAVAEFHEEEMAISDHIVDDDWEGIERSELEKDFAVAANYCGSESVSDDLKMRLYGLHKVATEGPCYEPQPMALKVTARAKWNAWQQLGSMNPDVAMEQYITILSENLPNWKEGKSSVPTEADIPNPVSGLNTKSIHQPNIAEDRTGASNANLVDNDAVIKDKSLVVKAEE